MERQELIELVNRLPENRLPLAYDVLSTILDDVDEESLELSEEAQRSVERALAGVGKVYTHEEVRALVGLGDRR